MKIKKYWLRWCKKEIEVLELKCIVSSWIINEDYVMRKYKSSSFRQVAHEAIIQFDVGLTSYYKL